MGKPTHKILPHGEPEELAPGLWNVEGSLPFPLRRNMIVYRLGDGSLLLHSVVAMNEAGMARLNALGRPSVMVVPQIGHRMDASFYKSRYPDMRVLCPAAARSKVEEVVKVDGTCEAALPVLGVRVHAIDGCKSGELAYEVDIPGGRALILCDVVANPYYQPGLGGAFFRTITGGIKARLGVARIVRLMLVEDKAAVRASLQRLAEVPDLRLLSVAHGHPLRDDCAGALREAAALL